tara:strand:- start:565 stop:750 length:186 start_codon:yes stop_codon:yes gene_type:complete
MDRKEIEELVSLRAILIKEFTRLRDYKNNKNAIMKEVDCARILDSTIKKIDSLLTGKVEFK